MTIQREGVTPGNYTIDVILKDFNELHPMSTTTTIEFEIQDLSDNSTFDSGLGTTMVDDSFDPNAPQLYIIDVSFTGVVSIGFTRQLKVPSNITSINNER